MSYTHGWTGSPSAQLLLRLCLCPHLVPTKVKLILSHCSGSSKLRPEGSNIDLSRNCRQQKSWIHSFLPLTGMEAAHQNLTAKLLNKHPTSYPNARPVRSYRTEVTSIFPSGASQPQAAQTQLGNCYAETLWWANAQNETAECDWRRPEEGLRFSRPLTPALWVLHRYNHIPNLLSNPVCRFHFQAQLPGGEGVKRPGSQEHHPTTADGAARLGSRKTPACNSHPELPELVNSSIQIVSCYAIHGAVISTLGLQKSSSGTRTDEPMHQPPHLSNTSSAFDYIMPENWNVIQMVKALIAALYRLNNANVPQMNCPDLRRADNKSVTSCANEL